LLAHLTDTLQTLITNLYISTGLLGIVLAMTIESCGIPLPSEIVMPVAGIMIAEGHILRGVNPLLAVFLVALAGAIGNLLGSTIAYWIGFKGGRPLILKYGRYVLISQHDADVADRFFQRWGSATAFFSRLLPVVRTYISFPAGISKMSFGKFFLYTLLGALPWSFALAYVGTFLGRYVHNLSSVFHGFDIVVIVAVVALVALYIWRHIHNDRKARIAHAAQANARMQPPYQQSPQAWGQPPQGWNPQQPPQAWGQPPQGWNSQQLPQVWGQPPQGWNPQQPPQAWGQPPQGWNPQQQAPNGEAQQTPPQPWPPQTRR
jgi:membrane protein DedA with SNARE-associated domain